MPSEDVAPKIRRSAGNAALIATLMVVAAGGVGFGLYEFQRAQRETTKADELRTAAAMNSADLAAAKSANATATAGVASEQAKAVELQAQVDQLAAERDRLKALFPLSATSFNTAAIDGSYSLSLSPVDGACTGFSNADATCVVANFPTDLVVMGNAAEGLTVASSWFGAVTLNALGSSWTGQGTLYDTVANTCGGAPLPTSVEIALSVDNVGPSADQTTLHAGQISGTLTFASGETEQCVGAGRAATFVTAPVASAG
jgi:hypothetical protein